MHTYRAEWVCPIAGPPIRDGWVAVRAGRIEAVGGAADAPPTPPRELGRAAIMPGLVNAHTHLELSWLRGRVPPAASFIEWIKQLFVTRGGRIERPDDAKVTDAARDAAREMRDSGTCAVGDISNSLATVEAIRANGMRGFVFHELLGFKLTDGQSVVETRTHRATANALGGDLVHVGVAPHAPYSVSAELFRAIRDEVNRQDVPITSVHLGESDSEVEFLRDGSGPWPAILRWVGAARDDWQPPGKTPVEYLDDLGMLDAATIVVHAVQLSDADLSRLRDIGTTIVTCPRSNQWVGVGVPPVARFYETGVRLAIGTDSLASVGDLNLFSELKTMRWLAPEVAPSRLLQSATLTGAEALGLGAELGTIEPGKRAELIAVTLDGTVAGPQAADQLWTGDEVQEYLVSGIDPRQIRWLA